MNESLQRYTVRRVRRSAATQPLIIVALGKHPADAASERTRWNVARSAIEAVRAIKSDNIKPQARTD